MTDMASLGLQHSLCRSIVNGERKTTPLADQARPLDSAGLHQFTKCPSGYGTRFHLRFPLNLASTASRRNLQFGNP